MWWGGGVPGCMHWYLLPLYSSDTFSPIGVIHILLENINRNGIFNSHSAPLCQTQNFRSPEFLLIIFCVQFHYIEISSNQEAKIYQSPIPALLSDDLQWKSLLRMIVSSLFFCWSYTLYNIQGWQWGNISTAQEQHSDQILAKYENIGKLKKVEWLTPVVEKIFHKCPNLCCYVPSEATMWRCWDGNLSKFTTFYCSLRFCAFGPNLKSH